MKRELLTLWRTYLDFLLRDPAIKQTAPRPIMPPSFEGFMAWIEQTEVEDIEESIICDKCRHFISIHDLGDSCFRCRTLKENKKYLCL